MTRSKSDEPNKEIVALRVVPDKLKKVKYIAWYQRDTFTDVVNASLDITIKKFEKENGEITEEQVKKALKK